MRAYFLILFLCAGCSLSPALSPQKILRGKVLLAVDTTWQGEVLVDGEVTVAYGTTLKILPGTQVRFVRKDADRDGLGDATIIVKGRLIAAGTESDPIRFMSAESQPRPGDWLEIRSDFARELSFDWCEFRDSAYTLHAHFTRGHLLNSHIHHNIDGCRLGRSRFLVQYNLIENNSGKGINFRDSEVTLTDNIIRDNRTGIFLFEKPGKSVLARNNLYRNGLNLQLGDFFAENLTVSNNWWGSSDPEAIDLSIHDQQDDQELGRVSMSPKTNWLPDAGIHRSAEIKPLWRAATDGFIDSSPVQVGDSIIFASWDGRLRAVDSSGRQLWLSDTGDVIDADLLVAEDQVYLQNWSRQFYAVDPADGVTRLLYTYPESPSDDHRQAGITRTGEFLLLPGWNGTLYAFERHSQKLLWQFDAGQPLRARPLVTGDRIYIASGQGTLTALNFQGRSIWQHEQVVPVLSAPVLLPGGVLFLDKTGTVELFDLNGNSIWQRQLEQTCFYAVPLAVDHAILVATAAGDLWKLNQTDGQVIWRRSLGASLYASPVVSGAGILIGDNDGHMHLLDLDSGRDLATYVTDGAIQSRVLVTGNRLYFGGRDQNLHALLLLWGGAAE